MNERSIFIEALDKTNAAQRAAYLDAVCGEDVLMRRRIEKLLAAHEAAGGILDHPAVAEEATGPHRPLTEGSGTVVGPYKLLQKIGEGGFGIVFMAEQQQPVRRMVALKIIKPGMDTAQVIARFESERQALALMDHPNIARVLDAGATESGRPYFVMELVKGVPITEFCDKNHLPPEARLKLFIDVCHAIQHAHHKGVIHRDVKPSNVMVTLHDGVPVVKVIDFGVAKATVQKLTERTLFTAYGQMIGTPAYMSPEQAEMSGLDIDTRSDVYSLGVLLYELLTGTTPLESKRLREAGYAEMQRLIREEEAPRPSNRLSSLGDSATVLAGNRGLDVRRLVQMLSGDLDWIVMKALDKDRNRRYGTPGNFAEDIQRYLRNDPIEARPPSASYRLRKFVRRNKGRVITAGVFATMFIALGGLVLRGLWLAERQSAKQALTAARNNAAFKATLDQMENALKAARLAEAGALSGQADRQIDEQTPADLWERHEQLRRDERTIRELDDIFEERWMVSPSDTRIDSERAKRRYPPLFQKYGLAVSTEPAAATVEKIRRSVITEALTSSMTEWFFVDPKYPGLLAVVDLLDPEPDRATLRAGIVAGNNDSIARLAKTIDGSKLSPAYAIGLGIHPGIEDPLRILKAAWTAHPESFPLVLTICSRLYENFGDDFKGNTEAVGWGRTAVSLRPNNPLTHYYHAIALSGCGGPDVARAVDELNRTIRLAPQFSRAYGRLAFVLQFKMKGDNKRQPEALAAARIAIKLDNQSILGNLVVFRQLLDDGKDYMEAARVYRRLKKSFQNSMLDNQPSEGGAEAYAMGVVIVLFESLLRGLIFAQRPFEAYCLIEGDPRTIQKVVFPGELDDSGFYFAAHTAALAGTGQGSDAPPPKDRPAIRKHALEWLTSSFAIWNMYAEALPVLGASTVGLMGSPSGPGPVLLGAFVLSPGSPHLAVDLAKNREIVHKGMNHWLSDPNLARVRDDQWLDKLPGEEREKWRKLWSEVRSLRDRTAPAKNAQPVRTK